MFIGKNKGYRSFCGFGLIVSESGGQYKLLFTYSVFGKLKLKLSEVKITAGNSLSVYFGSDLGRFVYNAGNRGLAVFKMSAGVRLSYRNCKLLP